MLKRYMNFYLIVTSVTFVIMVGIGEYVGQEHNSGGERCDYGVPREKAHDARQKEPCWPSFLLILREVAVASVLILLPVQAPAYVYLTFSTIVHRRRMRSSRSA